MQFLDLDLLLLDLKIILSISNNLLSKNKEVNKLVVKNSSRTWRLFVGLEIFVIYLVDLHITLLCKIVRRWRNYIAKSKCASISFTQSSPVEHINIGPIQIFVHSFSSYQVTSTNLKSKSCLYIPDLVKNKFINSNFKRINKTSSVNTTILLFL